MGTGVRRAAIGAGFAALLALAACGGGGSGGGTQTPTFVDRHVYVANSTGGTVSGYRSDAASGVLAELATSPFATGQGLVSLALHPNGRWLYATRSFADGITTVGVILGFGVDPSTGGLAPLPWSPLSLAIGPTPVFPLQILVHPSGEFAALIVFTPTPATALVLVPIDPATGAPEWGPTFITPITDIDFNPASLAFTPDGSFLYVGSRTGNGLFGFAVDTASPDLGTPLSGLPTAGASGQGTFAVTTNAAGTRLYAVVADADPTGAPDGPGEVLGFAVAPDGSLTAVPGSPPAVGHGPFFDLAVDPSGTTLYVTSQAGETAGTDGKVWAFAVAADGSLTPVSGSPWEPGGGPSAVAVDPTGRFVYVTDQDAGIVDLFARDPSGALTPLAPPSVAAGSGPIDLLVVP